MKKIVFLLIFAFAAFTLEAQTIGATTASTPSESDQIFNFKTQSGSALKLTRKTTLGEILALKMNVRDTSFVPSGGSTWRNGNFYRLTGTGYVYFYGMNGVRLDFGDTTQTGAVTSVAGRTGVVVLTKSDVGLGSVDNTADANKPVSTATQTALNAKQATLVSATNIKTINGNSILGSGDLTISGGGSSITTYDAGNGCLVTATGTGVTFTRPSTASWTLAIPSGVKVLSAKIYTASGGFPGTNTTITYDYTSNTVTNQGATTQDPPRTTLWSDAATGSFIDYTTGGTTTANWRSTITSVGSGDIVVQYTFPSAVTSGNTLVTLSF